MRIVSRLRKDLAIGLLVALFTTAVVIGVGYGLFARQAAPVTSPELPRQLTAHERDLLHEAEQILVQDCMREHGFEYWLAPPERLPGERDFPYVVDDVAWASRYGFGSGFRNQHDAQHSADPNRSYFQSLSPDRQDAALTALLGAQSGGIEIDLPAGGKARRSGRGCVAAAQNELYDDIRTWFRVETITDTLAGAVYGATVKDPRYQKALVRWAACMRAAGQPFATPADLHAALPENLGPVPPAPEIKAAVAEATCANKTPLAATARELAAHYQDFYNKRHWSEVTTRRSLALDAIPLARGIVAK